MAVYGWIRSNLNTEGDKGDYLVRFCSSELKEYKDILWKLSNRMLSTQNRKLDEYKEKQRTWFAGYLDKEQSIYAIALSGKQEDILNIEYSKREETRGLYSVLVLAFTDEDAKKVYIKNDNIFKPLKDILIEIINNKDISNRAIEQDFSDYVEITNSNNDYDDYNIMQSSENLDLKLWNLSHKRNVITGVLTKSDGIKLFSLFPDAIITVAENIPSQKISTIVYDNDKIVNKKTYSNNKYDNFNNKNTIENSNDINYIFSEENIKKSAELLRKSIIKAMDNLSTIYNQNQISNKKISENKQLFYIKKISELCKLKLSAEQKLCIEKTAERISKKISKKIKPYDYKYKEQLCYFAYMYYYDNEFIEERIEFVLKNWIKQFKKFGEMLDSNYYMSLRLYDELVKKVK